MLLLFVERLSNNPLGYSRDRAVSILAGQALALGLSTLGYEYIEVEVLQMDLPLYQDFFWPISFIELNS